MIANISNQNFGYSVACDGYWSAIGNPNSFRYDNLTSSLLRTGSIEIYKYNINSDIHDLKTTLYRPITSTEEIILSTENISDTGSLFIHTEYTGSVPITSDLDLSIDTRQYYTSSEDGYGWSLDLRDTLLCVGNPYFSSKFTLDTTSSNDYTGYGSVDLYDLSTLDIDPYADRIEPIINSTSSVNGFIQFQITVPSFQNFTSVIIQTKNLNSSDDWQSISTASVSNVGGDVTIQSNYSSLDGLDYRVVGVIGSNPYLTTILNPNSEITNSFGYSISLNDEWLAVGSPLDSGSKGCVFMYRKNNNNNVSWSLQQTLTIPSDIQSTDNFGHSICLNKASSSFSWSMIVGTNKSTNSKAYVYEFDGDNWNNTFTLLPDSSSIYPLPFYPTSPLYQNNPNISDGFGYDVSMYEDSIMVGAPYDRIIKEYPSSSLYKQGAVYFFDRCSDRQHGYYLVNKSYGNEKIIKNNELGKSVSIYDKYAVAGVPKINCLSSSICYLRGSLFQEHFCGDNLEQLVNGQFILFNKNTSSISSTDEDRVDWDITNIYQVKKRFLSPYRVYGWDVDISNQFITIGCPMLISGSNTVMDLTSTTGSFTGSVNIIGDLCGKSYIYNLKNLRPNFYVGNVFYKNGKIVIMTSGSNFEGLQLDDTIDGKEYEYQLNFKSKQTIFEKQIVCSIEPGEFNVSTNPTAIVLPEATFDINKNGVFDFQDVDVLLRYMIYKNTQVTGTPKTDWSSSILDTTTDEELSVYNMYYNQWKGTDNMFSSSYSNINNNLFSDLDFNDDNKINLNDMNILWKYFIYRLTQKNYESYITPSSKKKFLSDILDYMNSKTLRGIPPVINSNFLDYSNLIKQDPTGSYLTPYVTTIGLYSGTELIAIAKIGSPIKITPDFPLNFIIKMDF